MRTEQRSWRDGTALCVKYAIALVLLVGVLLTAQLEPTWRSLVAVDMAWFAAAMLTITALVAITQGLGRRVPDPQR